MKTASATDVKNHFGEYLQSTLKEPLVIEKTGRPVAVLVSMEDYERLQALEDAYWIRKAKEAEAEGMVNFKDANSFLKSLAKTRKKC